LTIIQNQALQQFLDIKHSYNPRKPDRHFTLALQRILYDAKVEPAVLQTRIQKKGLRLEFVDPYLTLQPELIEVSYRT